MAAEATRAATIGPRSGVGGLEPWQTLHPARPGQTSLPLPPDQHHGRHWKRSALLQGLGAFLVFIAMVHMFFGSFLLFASESLHLVLLKSWYPFWGGASFLISGISTIGMEVVPKASLRVLCLITNFISFFCVLAGLFVMAKDLFLESPFESLFWRPYSHNRVLIQRLELILFCLTCLELFLPGITAFLAYRSNRLSAEDDLSLVPDTSLGFSGPPPPYEDVTQGNTQEEQKQSVRGSLPSWASVSPTAR